MTKAKRIKSTITDSIAFEAPVNEIHRAANELVERFKTHHPEADLKKVKASGTIHFTFKD